MTEKRYAIKVRGVVQGVGFRPFVYGLAQHCHLSGWVCNDASGVLLEIEGEDENCVDFIRRLSDDAPSLAVVDNVYCQSIPLVSDDSFTIRRSRSGEHATLIAPDMGICDDCLAELRDPHNRRYRYPFINCTNCGPRFTIICDLPYDRPLTTMQDFNMCDNCAQEYHNPSDRRFHAQPNACAVCGPQLTFLNENFQEPVGDPIQLAVSALNNGKIVAVKGLGGYHLACNAMDEDAVLRLRQRKYRFDKPFAVMLPDIAAVRKYCLCSEDEAGLLTSQRRPIVLLRLRESGFRLAPSVAPGNGRLGVMLPYTPLHYLLMEQHPALVMTSGNVSDEPIVFDDEEVTARLGSIADCFLMHDRRIFRRCDDSVVIWAAGAPRLIRRSRGYAPQPLSFPDCGEHILAVGAEQKNIFCLTRHDKIFLSQHIGDLDNVSTLDSFQREIADFERMFAAPATVLAYDMHPEYLSTKYIHQRGDIKRHLAVQHHHAHFAAVLAEYNVSGAAIGLIYDGTGWGLDGTLWGGEVFVGNKAAVRRAAHLRPLCLPGASQAIREPWRQALSALSQCVADDEIVHIIPELLRQEGWQLLISMIRRGVNAPFSSGMGRLFDAAAALCGVGLRTNYEGQAAVELEQLIDVNTVDAYKFVFGADCNGITEIDWRPLILAELEDVRSGVAPGVIAARFHRAVVNMSLDICRQLRAETGLNTVALAGGCWMNVYLLEQTVAALQVEKFTVLINQQVPYNDGGIAYGQAAVTAEQIERGMM